MKCEICKEKTTWDESFGRREFIVCPHCFEKIRKMTHSKSFDVTKFICAIGWIREELNEEM